MVFDYQYIIVGAIVGFMIGLTGIGGGSLMAPILILFLGIIPSKVVGTDLFFASITKLASTVFFFKEKHINWRITKLLAFGSIPSSFITLLILKWLDYHNRLTNTFFQKSMAVAIMILAFIYLIRSNLKNSFGWSFDKTSLFIREVLTIFSGCIIGVSITLTSIGAGILGTVALMVLYPNLQPISLIATEIAHTIPLALLAGIGHASLGNLDTPLLLNLLFGSLPAAYLGSKLACIVPTRALRILLSSLLFLISAKLILA